MRHLYNAAKEPGVSFLIDKAKLFERRRCGHLPADYPEPLSTTECLTSVVDAKGSGRNKHCYVVASQDVEVRRKMRAVVGVPLVYINRSVMIMEPMAEATGSQRDREEKGKFRDGLKRGSGSVGMKRKREDGEEGGGEEKRKKKVYGQPKGPNPLSVKKAKKEEGVRKVKEVRKERGEKSGEGSGGDGEGVEGEVKKKTRRKRKAGAGAGAGEGEGGVAVAVPAAAADAGDGMED